MMTSSLSQKGGGGENGVNITYYLTRTFLNLSSANDSAKSLYFYFLFMNYSANPPPQRGDSSDKESWETNG